VDTASNASAGSASASATPAVAAGSAVQLDGVNDYVTFGAATAQLGASRFTIETWFRADKPGVFYGECNQICGTNHSRMPIVVRAVSPEDFATWLDQAKTKFSDAAPPPAPAESATHQLAQAGVQR
jgi:hypothetical protein